MPSQWLTVPEELSSECVLLPVPFNTIPILAGLLERMEWRASYRSDGDFERGLDLATDWQRELGSMECTNALNLTLQSILEALQSMNICCLQSAGHVYDDEPPDDFRRMIGDPPGGGTWGEYDLYVCQAAQKHVDLALEVLRELAETLSVLGAFGIEALALILTPVAAPLSLVLAVAGLLVDIIAEEAEDEFIGDMQSMAPELICAIFESYTPQVAKSAVDSIINANFPTNPKNLLYKTLWNQTSINQLYAREYEGLEAYDETYCEHECLWGPRNAWHFEGSLEGFWMEDPYQDSYVTYDPNETYPGDPGGSMYMWGRRHWGGPWYARAMAQTTAFVGASTRISWRWKKLAGETAQNSALIIYYADETTRQVYVTDPPGDTWGFVEVDPPPADNGKLIVGIQIATQLSNNGIWIDDVWCGGY